MSQSPQPQSPELGGRIEMQPTTAPPTKRDKRRQQLADRLAEITHNFSQNRDLYCRQELLALQVDMHLITEADPHKGKLLDDQGDQIQKAVEEIASRTMTKSINPPEGAGRIYADFVKEVNDAAEQRDADLELHQRDYEVELAKLHATAAYRERLARNEHTALSTTLRDRLINSLTSKKARLARDKETIEIGESNALLLHPSQYSIMNPDSPSGQQSKRATRHRRDLDGELPSFSEGKRKRKAIESDESPAPPHHEKRARHDGGTSTPLWQSDKPWRNEKNEMENSQIKKGLYSIDKLFTEKELAMTYNAAALASHNYMVKHPPYETETDSPPNGKIELTSDFKALMHNPTDENEDEASARASPVTMERQYSHATRSTRHVPSYQTGIGIDGITDINIPENFQALYRQTPKLPPNLPSVMQKAYVKGDAANQPAGLTPEEAAAELDMIKKCRAYNDDRGYGRNLELEYGGLSMLKNVANPISRSDMKGDHYWVTSNDKGLISELRNELGFDGEPMSKQSSKGGSDMGTPMSRQGTQDGAMSGRGRKGLSRIG